MKRSLVEGIRSDPGLAESVPKTVYVLSGGSAKGFCHVGMLERLEGRGVAPDLVVGTSAGALIGALYCHFGNAAEIIARMDSVFASGEFSAFGKKYFGERQIPESRGLKHSFSSISGSLRAGVHLGMSLLTSAMVSEKDTSAVFEKMFEGVTAESLKIPFAAAAVDLAEGKIVVFTAACGDAGVGGSRAVEGHAGLVRAVMASCAIPLVFPSVSIGGSPFADGSIMANFPAREARSLLPGSELLLAGFDLLSPVERYEEKISSLALALRLFDLATRSKERVDKEQADIVFSPVRDAYPWSSFAEHEAFVDLGREYMTDERLDSFEDLFALKCRAKLKKDGISIKSIIALARLAKILRAHRSGAFRKGAIKD
jgi:NTE family protein